MKILITGGAGYLGTELLNKLSKSELVDEVVIYDNLSRRNRNVFLGENLSSIKIQFVHGDLLDSRKLRSALKGVDVVYHLAANVTTPFSDQNPHLFEQVNHWGTAELVYALEESKVKKLIHLSSVSVYGTSSQKLNVTSTLNPKTFYGISKMRAEEHVNRIAKKIDTFVIRCGNVYGYSKSMRFDAVINKFMFDANFANRISVNGSGEQRRPFVGIDEVSIVLREIGLKDKKPGTYNLVGENRAIGEVVEEVRKIYPNLEILFVNQQMKMRELLVEPSDELKKIYGEPNSLATALRNFRANFSF